MARLRALAAVGALLLVLASGAWVAAQQMPWQSAAVGAGNRDAPAVRYLYPEQVSVAAGRATTVELHFRIRDGLHINSHTPLQKSLIRTELMVVEPAGVKVEAVDFPAGTDYALKAFPNEKLSVYTGEVVLKAHVTAVAGEHLLQGVLRYQACDTDSCYPPKKVALAVDVVAK